MEVLWTIVQMSTTGFVSYILGGAILWDAPHEINAGSQRWLSSTVKYFWSRNKRNKQNTISGLCYECIVYHLSGTEVVVSHSFSFKYLFKICNFSSFVETVKYVLNKFTVV